MEYKQAAASRGRPLDEKSPFLGLYHSRPGNGLQGGPTSPKQVSLWEVHMCGGLTRSRPDSREDIVSNSIGEGDVRLKPNEKIAGRPAKEVRALIRRLSHDLWTVKEAADLLRVPEARARRFVYALRIAGLRRGGTRAAAWYLANTMAGNTLAHATAALPISRAHADRHLKEFLARVETVNGDESWPYRVGKVVLFGSYLSNQESVGDIDLAIRLERRAVFADHWPEAVLARADAAARQGRRFRGFLRLSLRQGDVPR